VTDEPETGSATGAQDNAAILEAGRLLFAGPCEFIWAAAKADNLPPLGPPEIAFAGRSNVGKSSLLNALTGRNALARTSHTPGRTQQLNFFALGGAPGAETMRLVDMPGYGYASASKEKIASWTRLMKDYLRGRSSLARVFVLVDGRHGVKDVDKQMFDLLDQSAVSYQVVLTKRDEVKKSEIDPRIAATLDALKRRPAAYPETIFTSSRTGESVPELRAAVARLLAEKSAAR
jgi:GTP-binding protein